MKVWLANPRGFCAGVERAIAIVEEVLRREGPPVYVRHELVHNRGVVQDLASRGVVFVDEVEQAPQGVPLVFSAHGVSAAVERAGKEHVGPLFDATCPLVTKVHINLIQRSREGYDCVLIGHQGHPEVEGTLGRFDDSAGGRIYLVQSEDEAERAAGGAAAAHLAWSSQTTLSVDETAAITKILERRFPGIRAPRGSDICYATQNRQEAVRELAAQVKVMLVVGSQTSSNSGRLRELAQNCGARAYLLDRPELLDPAWFADLGPQDAVGITAGASSPESQVRAVADRLCELGGEEPQEFAGTREELVFSMPASLR